MDKLPPHNNAAENAVIASIVIDWECLPKVMAILKPGDFLQERARLAYEAALSLYNRKLVVNQMTIFYELERLGNLKTVGEGYLSTIIANMPSCVWAEHYARIVKEMADRRHTIQEAGTMAKDAYEGKQKRKWGQFLA